MVTHALSPIHTITRSNGPLERELFMQARNQGRSGRTTPPPVCRQKTRFRSWKKVFERAIKL